MQDYLSNGKIEFILWCEKVGSKEVIGLVLFTNQSHL